MADQIGNIMSLYVKLPDVPVCVKYPGLLHLSIPGGLNLIDFVVFSSIYIVLY